MVTLTDQEAAIVAKAEADIAAGLGIGDEDIEAWLDLLDTDSDAPLPTKRGGLTIR